MPRIEFEADTQEELVEMARRWVGASRPVEPPVARSEGTREDALIAQIREVVMSIKGVDSRRLVRELSEAAVAGEAIVLNDELVTRYGKSTGTAFAGIVGGPNKLMRRIARRDLISWDASAAGYRIHPADAEIVLKYWPE